MLTFQSLAHHTAMVIVTHVLVKSICYNAEVFCNSWQASNHNKLAAAGKLVAHG